MSSNEPMITEQQRARRSQGIFSSDVPRILEDGQGVAVALEKMGHMKETDFTGNREIAVGTKGEALILDAYEHIKGVKLERSPDTIWHPTLRTTAGKPWMGCHLDARWANGRRVVVEGKAIGWYNEDEWGMGGDQIPSRVLWQVQEQMECTDSDEAHVAVCFVNEDTLKDLFLEQPPKIVIYVVPRSEKLCAHMIKRSGYVWDCVLEGKTPEPERLSDARLIYRKDSGGIIEADEQAFKAWRELVQLRELVKQGAERLDELKDQLRMYMGENSQLRYLGHTLATNYINHGRAGYTVEPVDPYRSFLAKAPKKLLEAISEH